MSISTYNHPKRPSMSISPSLRTHTADAIAPQPVDFMPPGPVIPTSMPESIERATPSPIDFLLPGPVMPTQMLENITHQAAATSVAQPTQWDFATLVKRGVDVPRSTLVGRAGDDGIVGIARGNHGLQATTGEHVAHEVTKRYVDTSIPAFGSASAQNPSSQCGVRCVLRSCTGAEGAWVEKCLVGMILFSVLFAMVMLACEQRKCRKQKGIKSNPCVLEKYQELA